MLIVLEGLDGAGKSTQIAMLREYLTSCGIESEYLHFPRFDSPVYGELIARFLRGEFGQADQVDPYIVALFFAGDRAHAAKQLREWMQSGKAVILDRYVYSNIAYQCAKLGCEQEREELKRWILEMEYTVNDIPRPDLSIFLNVPFSFTEDKLTNIREGEDRDYLKGKSDIHETSLDLQRLVRETYLEAAKSDDKLCVIDCADEDGNMGTPQANFEKIRTALTKYVNI